MRALAALILMSTTACGVGNSAPATVAVPTAAPSLEERVTGLPVDMAQVAEVVGAFESWVAPLTTAFTVEFTSDNINHMAQGVTLKGSETLGGVTLGGRAITIRMIDFHANDTSDVRRTMLFHELMHVHLREIGATGNKDHTNPMWQIVKAYQDGQE